MGTVMQGSHSYQNKWYVKKGELTSFGRLYFNIYLQGEKGLSSMIKQQDYSTATNLGVISTSCQGITVGLDPLSLEELMSYIPSLEYNLTPPPEDMS